MDKLPPEVVIPRAALLASAGSRALIVGSGTETFGNLPAITSLRRTVSDLGHCLIDNAGLAPEHLITTLDPGTPQEFADILGAAAQDAEDVLLFYYIGHGLVARNGDLHLETRATVDITEGVAQYQALPYSIVSEVLAKARSRLIVVVLDCCFSGRAHAIYDGTFDNVFRQTRREGSFVLAAAGNNVAAWAPKDKSHTLFTGEFIGLLKEGEAAGPRTFNLEQIYEALLRRTGNGELTRPRKHAIDFPGDQPLAANQKYLTPESPVPPPDWDINRRGPYLGLSSFDVADSAYFFAREEVTQELVRRVSSEIEQEGPLIVMGPSGAGKSSLLHAGLIAALRRHGLTGGGIPICLSFTPRSDPVHQLALRLEEHSGVPAAEIEERIKEVGSSVTDFLPSRARPEEGEDSRPLVFVVDQFEELFTSDRPRSEQEQFVRALCTLSSTTGSRPPAPARVVLGIRSDFYSLCSTFGDLHKALQRHVLVPAMDQRQLREVIEEPANEAGLALEKGLAHVVLQEIGMGLEPSGEGPERMLPLLSYAMLATYQRSDGRTLTLAGYHATGGIMSALARTADRVYESLSAEDQKAARRMLLRLVRLGDGTEDSRRQVPMAELIPDGRLRSDSAHLRFLNVFVNARLLTTDGNVVEITHEALIRAWPRLRGWIKEDRTNLLTYQRLVEDATQWQRHHRDSSYLYQARRLAAAQDATAELDQVDRTPVERAFLEESTKRSQRRSRLVRGGVVITSLIAVAAVVIFYLQNRELKGAGNAAVSRQLAAESNAAYATDPRTSMKLAVAAWRVSETNEARTALLGTTRQHFLSEFTGSTGEVEAVAFSPDGQLLATTGDDGAVRLWDVPRRRAIASLSGAHEYGANALAFSADGTLLASLGMESGVRIWSTATRHLVRSLPVESYWGHTKDPYSVAFSPDGRWLAVASGSVNAQLWSIPEWHKYRLPDREGTSMAETKSSSVAFTKAGDRLLVADFQGNVEVWDVKKRKLLNFLKAPVSPIPFRLSETNEMMRSRVSVSSDEQTVGVANERFSYSWIWQFNDIKGDMRPLPIFGHTAQVNALAFGPFDRMFATGSDDGSVRLWGLDGRDVKQRQLLTGHRGSVSALAFSPDGQLIATGGADRTVRLWSTRAASSLNSKLPPAAKPVTALAVDPSEQLLAFGEADGTVEIRDRSGRLVAHLRDSYQPETAPSVLKIVFSGNSSRVAILLDTGEPARIWDIVKKKKIFTIDTNYADIKFREDGGLVASGDEVKAFDPKGHPAMEYSLQHGFEESGTGSMGYCSSRDLVALSDGAKNIELFNGKTGKRGASLLGAKEYISLIAFTPSCDLIAAKDAGDVVRVWNVETRQLLATLPDMAFVEAMGFSKDGRRLNMMGGEAVTVWNRGELSGVAPAKGSDAAGRPSALSLEGDLLLSVDGPTQVESRSLDPASIATWVCKTLGSGLTRTEWQQFAPKNMYKKTC
ncbi:caspase, EACC1-associated type [Actinomadura macrotermitis]|uniref:Peptidase C14 caspase domain-containing protein n=1 Tax=Actinomadura macrotermitis TaxID=2585200 RepID=A0A7K0C729_9ACTN|nr:AAA family ATPase [Actinomadura macrotermitis]MQY09243.1 hypothetical protein [Actinomadura macrotermitis]